MTSPALDTVAAARAARSRPPQSLPVALGQPVPVCVAYGDGIGPEIMEVTLAVLKAAGARLALEPVELGAKVYERGVSAGIDAGTWASLRRTRVLLKAPVTTPSAGGYKSLNVTLRKTLGMFANVRPCASYHPFVSTRHPGMNLVIVRENEEDLYAGIEHRPTRDVVECLKIVSVPGTERIVRYAFEYARAYGRRKVTCMTKDNIMKMTDGLFSSTFRRIGTEYPELEQEHMIIDVGTAMMADEPERFDVVVTPNLYGDILSDVAAQVAGSIGMAGSANIGRDAAMFEAIHGSAPAIARRNFANPSGLIQAAVMMLVHIGQNDVATTVQNAWLATIEDGLHTPDIWTRHGSGECVGTAEFAQAVINRIGRAPRRLAKVDYGEGTTASFALPGWTRADCRKELVGVDVFLDAADAAPEALATLLQPFAGQGFALQMITNRGVKVWPDGMPETFCTDHWRCRFVARGADPHVEHGEVVALLANLAAAGFDFVKTQNLYRYDGIPGYTLGHGQ
jgi:isocitrate dehydrogenase